jgi:hypothetical protein
MASPIPIRPDLEGDIAMAPKSGDDDTVDAIGAQLAVLNSKLTRMQQDLDLLRGETKDDIEHIKTWQDSAGTQMIKVEHTLESIRAGLFNEDDKHALRTMIHKHQTSENDARAIETAVNAAIQTNRKTLVYGISFLLLSSLVFPLVLKLIGG